jgi:hypothetical protein
MKMYEGENETTTSIVDKSLMTFQGASAPQENRKNKKQNLNMMMMMVPTRNEQNELGMKESLESA